jgi:hypothetical protein
VAQRVSHAGITRLGQYWLRAQLMHDHLHALIDVGGPSLSGIKREDWWKFETYLLHWLAALFVVVEGFNKLKLKDAEVQKLFNEHVGELKKVRHETYHFVVEEKVFPDAFHHQRLNWAEDLHDAVGAHLHELVNRVANIERFMEKRVKLKNPIGGKGAKV